MNTLDASRFAEFFKAVYREESNPPKAPFPWQIRLSELVINSEQPDQAWPERIDLPTASGKTTCIDVAVFALASQAFAVAEGKRRSAPRRIFFVVDRRVIVDQAFEQAQHLARRLDQRDGGILEFVGDRLRNLARGPYNDDPVPLKCFQLRGGMYRDDAWACSPTQPMVICGTVDQIGSRLLFRGYGRSSKTWAIHAGLVGNDSLILLDEAHCAVPFEQTVRAVRRYQGACWAERQVDSPFSVTIMSATLRDDSAKVFGLGPADYQHEVLGPRLLAAKPATLVEAKGKTASDTFARSLVNEAQLLAKSGARRIAILVNRVQTAKMVFAGLAKVTSDRKGLFLGRMRPLDSDRVMEAWRPRLRSAQRRDHLPKPLFVVATQCLEVGADFDFDGLVCECASLDALRQRFGRLNRLGASSVASGVIVIAGTDAKGKEPDPIYGEALARTWRWLGEKSQPGETADKRCVDMGVAAVGVALAATTAEEKEQLFQQSRNAPVLLPAHIDCWVQTSPTPEPDPDIAIFLHGPQQGAPEVQVCWRADLDLHPFYPDMVDDAREQRWIETLALCPPSSGECMSVPLYIVRRWLTGDLGDNRRLSDVEGADPGEEPPPADRLATKVVRWNGPLDEGTCVLPSASELRPGDTIVVPARSGGWEHFGHIPDLPPGAPPDDLGDEANFAARARPILRIHPQVVPSWLPMAAKRSNEELPAVLLALLDLTRQAHLAEGLDEKQWLADLKLTLRRVANTETFPVWLRNVAATVGQSGGHSEFIHLHPCGWPTRSTTATQATRWADDGHGSGATVALDENQRELVRVPAPGGVILVGKRPRRGIRPVDAFTHEDDTSSSTLPVLLRQHLEGVALIARHFAAECGLSPKMQRDMELAGQLHDVGKIDGRFQAWLHGGDATLAHWAPEPLAKSSGQDSRVLREAARNRSKYPKGGRHELLSLQLTVENADAALAHADDSDLVLHLVASHHGFCRPFAPFVADNDPPRVQWKHEGAEFALTTEQRTHWRPHKLESGIPERFWLLVRRYGWWGLAWLEAIIILADARCSEYEVDNERTTEDVLVLNHEASQ